MSVVNLMLLGLGVAALAAPLWVHLRLGKVRKRARVSSLHLMLAARQTSRTPRRIVNWPLFLLRCAVLLLVALGFGRLLLPLLGSGGERAYVVLVADVSGSMQASHAGKPVWEDAQARLGAVLDGLDGASKVALVPSPLGDYQPQWESVAEARARLAKLAPGAAANRLVGELREGLRLLGELPDDHPKVLHVVSDLQRSAFAGIDQLGVPANVELQLDKVGPVQANNRGVTVSVLAAGATDIGMYGFNDGTSGEVELFEGGKAQKYAIAPGQVVSRLAKEGASKGEWVERRLVMPGEDALAADNTAYDVFEPQAPVPVWMFEPRPAAGTPAAAPAEEPGMPGMLRRRGSAPAADAPVVRVFDQACYYLGAALQPAFVGETAAESRLQPRVLKADELDRALADMDKPGAPRLLFVPALGEVPEALARLAGGLLERGGAVVWFGGPEVQPAVYQSKFGEWLPGAVGAPVAVPTGRSLATVDERHPLWGGLDAQTRRQLSGVKLRQRHTLEPVKGTRVLGYYADAQPLLVERKVGEGRAYFFNTSADRTWSDWPADPPLFVPALHLLVARALGDEALGAAHEPLLAGERRTLDVGGALAGRRLRCGTEEFPVDPQGRVSVRLATPGVVQLTTDAGQPVMRVAVNFPPSESVLQSYAQNVALQRLESLRQRSGAAAVRWEAGLEDGDLAWKLCLALGALLLLIEPVMANTRFKA